MRCTITEFFRFLNYKVSAEELSKSLLFFSQSRYEMRQLFEDLQWSNDIKTQNAAIKKLSEELHPWEYIYLIMPGYFEIVDSDQETNFYMRLSDKSRWENASKVIIQIGWPAVDHIIVPLFMWLLDSNWPGSNLIYDFLLTIPKAVLIDKMKVVIGDKKQYDPWNYRDLILQFEDLRMDLK